MRLPWIQSKTDNTDAESPSHPPVRANEVFTPSVPAARGFVGRQVEMVDIRKKGLNVPGTQIVVWGESGAGKSSLVNKALVDAGKTAVKVSCTPDSTYTEILEAAFSGTGAFFVSEKTEQFNEELGFASTVGSDLIGAKLDARIQVETGSGQQKTPIARPQMSPQRLVAELGSRNLSWVIEDFHKVPKPERDKLSHALKIFSDEGTKYPDTRIIILGVSDSIDELVRDSTNVGRRLIDIPVPPLDENELGKILDIGEELLNLSFSKIRSRLISTSVGTVTVTHALALSCCDERDVDAYSSERIDFTEDDFDAAVSSYARTRSSILRSRFRKALTVHRKRVYDNPQVILRALTELPESGGTVGEILAKVRNYYPQYPSGNATTYLKALQSEERGSLVRRTASGEYRFDEPLQHAFAKTLFDMTSPAEARDESDWVQVVSGSEGQLKALRADLEAETSLLSDASEESDELE